MNLRTKKFALFLVIFLSLFGERPQVFAAQEGRNKLNFNLDYAKFRYNQDSLFLEIYYSFPASQFAASQHDSLNLLVFNIEAKIFRGDSLLQSRSWLGKSTVRNDPGMQDQELFTLTNFVLPSGEFRLSTKLEDLVSGAESVKEVELRLTELEKQKLTLSDIELARSIEQDTMRSVYTKNSYKIIPNPMGIYGLKNPMLFFYCELYNLTPGDSSKYLVKYEILDSQGKLYREYPSKERQIRGASLVEVGGFNVVALPTGRYFLQLTVSELDTQAEVAQEKVFYILKEEQPRTGSQTEVRAERGILAQYYSSISEEAIDAEFASASLIATKEEKEVYGTLESDAKPKFMVEFWKKRDSVPSTANNEFRDTYLERVKTANEKYGGIKPGWKADRGRILILYGEPDEIDRNPSLGESRGYETWHYFSVEGGVIFIFVDRNSWDDLELVHSTARGQIYDPNWQRWLDVR